MKNHKDNKKHTRIKREGSFIIFIISFLYVFFVVILLFCRLKKNTYKNHFNITEIHENNKCLYLYINICIILFKAEMNKKQNKSGNFISLAFHSFCTPSNSLMQQTFEVNISLNYACISLLHKCLYHFAFFQRFTILIPINIFSSLY